MGDRKPIFDALPSGLDIAHWFKGEAFARRFENVGGDATLLWRGGSLYPYGTLHKIAEVDHDDQVFYLLEIGDHPGPQEQTYNLLFITAGLRESLACEWRNERAEHPPWGRDGLVWFADQIEEAEARQLTSNDGNAS